MELLVDALLPRHSQSYRFNWDYRLGAHGGSTTHLAVTVLIKPGPQAWSASAAQLELHDIGLDSELSHGRSHDSDQ